MISIVVISSLSIFAYGSDTVLPGSTETTETYGGDGSDEGQSLCTVCEGPWHIHFERVAFALASNNFDFAQKRRTKIATANFSEMPKAELARQIVANLRLRELEMDEDLLAYWQNYVKAANAELSLFHDDFAAALSAPAARAFAEIRAVMADDSLSQVEGCRKIVEIFRRNTTVCHEIQTQDTYRNRVDALSGFGPIAPSYALATVAAEEREKFLNIALNASQLSVPQNEINRQLSEWLATQPDEITAMVRALGFGGKVVGHLELAIAEGTADEKVLSPQNYDIVKKMTEIYVGGEMSASAACAQIGALVARLDQRNAKKSNLARVFARGAKNCDETFLAFRFLNNFGRFSTGKTFYELLTLHC